MKTTVISVVGSSNSGKTTLLEKLVKELSMLGYKVAVAKHVHHGGFDLDRPGKDSWRLREAGASAVLLSASSRIALMEETGGEEWPLERLLALAQNRADIVFTEGFTSAATSKIEVYRSGISPGLRTPLEQLLAVITDVPLAIDVPQFHPEEVSALMEYLLTKMVPLPPPATGHSTARPQNSRYSSTSSTTGRLQEFLRAAEAYHGHLCPGQIVGVRMALLGCDGLGITAPDMDKRLMVFVEVDRCATDAISVVTGCTAGKRSLKLVDYGKMAATFLDISSGRALRIVASDDARLRASYYASEESDPMRSQFKAYMVMPDEELFSIQSVEVTVSEDEMPGSSRPRVTCQTCGEQVSGGREVRQSGALLCRACASATPYYRITPMTLSGSRSRRL